jgi:hypothetical protein
VWVGADKSGAQALHAGELSAAGEPKDDGVIVAADPSAPKSPDDSDDTPPSPTLTPVAAVGAGDVRVIVTQAVSGGYAALISRDGGKTWPKEALAIADGSPGAKLQFFGERGRIDVEWNDGQTLWHLPLDPGKIGAGAPDKEMLGMLDPSESIVSCLAPNMLWLVAGEALVRVPLAGGAADRMELKRFDGDLTCDDEKLAVPIIQVDTTTVASCTTKVPCVSVMKVPVPPGGSLAARATAKHGVIAIEQVDDYLVRWSAIADGAQPAGVVIASGAGEDHLHDVIEWDGKVYAIMTSTERARIVELPLR